MVLTLKRNLYLSTQIMELGIPVIMAVNMVDIMEKNGDKVDLAKLRKSLDVKLLRYQLLRELALRKQQRRLLSLLESKKLNTIAHKFDDKVEAAISAVEDKAWS